MILSRLLAYDLLIVWKGARAAFSRKRDILLLLLAVPLVSLVAAQSASNAAATARDLPEPAKMLLVSVAAFFVSLAAERRLAHLETETIVARFALRRGPRLVHRLFWNALPLVISVWIMAAGSASAESLPVRAAALILAYAGGAGAAALAGRARLHLVRWSGRRRADSGAARPVRLPGEERRQRVTALIAARTGLAGPSIAANAAAFAVIGAYMAFLYWLSAGALPRPGPELIAASLAAAAYGLLLRQHPPLLRYLLYLGIGPVRPALVPAASAGSLAAGFVLGAAALNLPEAPAFAALGAGALLLFLILALLRALHYAIRSRQAAELAMQLDAVMILLAAFIAPPLALVVLAGRLFMLHRRARSLRFVAV